MSEEWQTARRKRSTSRRSKAHKQQASPTCQDHACGQEEFNTKKTLLRIRETMSELKCEDFWLDWKKLLVVSQCSVTASARPSPDDGTAEPPVDQQEESDAGTTDPPGGLECVCYGLGPFSSCVSARYQLAMLLLLLETLQEGKRLTKRPTVFYLMHCGKALYNNLLWRNWKRDTLPLLTIIGNSFSGIQDRCAVVACEERLLPCPPRLLDVFNDTAVITFSRGGLGQLPQSTWMAEPAEPQYEHCPDLEIVRRGDPQS
ncbi:hypothetical protein CRUP_009199 [Coryphaenoides rupestris]|nr:hypothetical protein CRUP_009199 [Coryphaenoides rupestris]